jgi:hypothetical protein
MPAFWIRRKEMQENILDNAERAVYQCLLERYDGKKIIYE